MNLIPTTTERNQTSNFRSEGHSSGFLSRIGGFFSAGWHVITDGGLILYALITSLAVTILSIFLPESAVNKITGACGYVLAFFEKIRGKITEIKLSYAKEDLAKAEAHIDHLYWQKECGVNLLQKVTTERNRLAEANEKLKHENKQLHFQLKQANEPVHVTFSYTPHSSGHLFDDLIRLQKFVVCLQQQSDCLPNDSDMRSTLLIIVHTAQKMINQFEGTNDLLTV